ncbi:NAD(P)H-dependent oxidoreductase [Panicum miliaceum]|uniref:NAD(P)H-dependent oxidoreductase n=1 Tax=Panicum miliaceum TaxID=4540 RepID=A0A3L6QBS9_PANMI|nr:NAD(P)H-dependent oxidoreductase [Panicum miliaceum]
MPLVPFDMAGVLRATEECHRLGLARSIGVSNFSSAKMSRLLSFAAVPPAVNQVELNVAWRQEKLREVCAKNSVVVTAISPLGAFRAAWGSNAVMESGALRESPTGEARWLLSPYSYVYLKLKGLELALRWLHEQGFSFVARSFNMERLKQNVELFDWELGEDDKELIMKIPQQRACRGEFFFMSPDGPYKSLEELWDGER